MFDLLVIAQIIGLMASGFVIFAYSFKDDVKTKKTTMAGSILFSIHFLLLGAYSAMGVTIVNVVRVWLSTKFHGDKLLCAFFVSVYLVIGYFTFQTPIDFFAITAPVIGCIAMFCFSGVYFRGLCLVATLSWLIYGLFIGSFGVVITQIFVSSVNLTTIMRIYKDRKKEPLDNE